MPLGVLEPDFAQSVVDRPGDDVHLRERAAEMRDAATAGDEEGDEDDVRRMHAVVEEHPDRHESRCASPDLQKKNPPDPHRVSQEIGGAKTKTCLRVEEEDPCLYRAASFADASG